MSQEPTNPPEDTQDGAGTDAEELDAIFLDEEADEAADSGEALFVDDDDDDVQPVEEVVAEARATADVEVVEDDEDEATAALSGRIAELEGLLESAREEAAQLKERLIRKAADLENARRRHQREKDEHSKYAAESVLKDIVPVLDDLERALSHLDGSTADASLLEGVQMVARKFAQALMRRGVEPVEALGQEFDPQYHEAIQQRQDDSVPHNTVVQEFQKGYVLHDRLLRPSLVVVAQGGPPREDAPADEAEADLADDDPTSHDGQSEANSPVDQD